MAESDLVGELEAFLAGHRPELIEFRRDLHAHPEIGYAEHRTTRRIALRLEAAGLKAAVLPRGTGLIADIGGSHDDAPAVALRADIDALPIVDEKNGPYRSLNAGACHACGHDVHTSVLLGTGLFLARVAAAGALPGKVRLIFQPAEEVPGGALDVLAAGGISSVDHIFALHCDPKLEVGKIGTRIGPITAACDKVKVQLTGPGGHTARPHLTADLVFALGKMITDAPPARRIDPLRPQPGVGKGQCGVGAQRDPRCRCRRGNRAMPGRQLWHAAPELMKDLVESIASAYGVTACLTYERSVPPVVNEAISTQMIAQAADQVLGPEAIAAAPQSLGGEDFAWYLESIPGSLFRLGTRPVGSVEEFDIHQPMFDVDEECIAVGVKVMTATALTAIGSKQADSMLTEADAPGRVAPLPSAGRIRHVRPSTGGVTLAGPLLASYSPVA
jgi:amidohydrolase